MNKCLKLAGASLLIVAAALGCPHIMPDSVIKSTGKEAEDMEKDMQKYTESSAYQDSLQLMKEKYGFDEESLAGIDIVRFVDDYQLSTQDYTKEEVKEILEEESDIYVIDETSVLFAFLEQDEGGQLPEDARVCRIGYYRHSGTLLQKMIFDLENKVFYLDTAEEHALTDSQVSELQELPFECRVPEWENSCEGEEEASTGSFLWKLVLECEDGTTCCYGGSTGDGTHLPDHFSELDKALKKMIKSVS